MRVSPSRTTSAYSTVAAGATPAIAVTMSPTPRTGTPAIDTTTSFSSTSSARASQASRTRTPDGDALSNEPGTSFATTSGGSRPSIAGAGSCRRTTITVAAIASANAAAASPIAIVRTRAPRTSPSMSLRHIECNPIPYGQRSGMGRRRRGEPRVVPGERSAGMGLKAHASAFPVEPRRRHRYRIPTLVALAALGVGTVVGLLRRRAHAH